MTIKPIKNVVVSGYFDPFHIGHLDMIEGAAKLGKVWVIVNNRKQAINKKGYEFMPFQERVRIVNSIEGVNGVFGSIDKDKTICKTLKSLSENGKVDIFANGGDRKSAEDLPEAKLCKELGIEMKFNVGGGKVQSSSELVNRQRTRFLNCG